ncbi:MAG: hypothetical protein AMXMBFR22_19080 [Phycisphaerae bacterium]
MILVPWSAQTAAIRPARLPVFACSPVDCTDPTPWMPVLVDDGFQFRPPVGWPALTPGPDRCPIQGQCVLRGFGPPKIPRGTGGKLVLGLNCRIRRSVNEA